MLALRQQIKFYSLLRYFIFNDKVLPEGTPVVGADNRGLRYGDGLFETMRLKNGSIFLLDYHIERLQSGIEKLRLKPPPHFTKEKIEKLVLQLAAKNNDKSCRVRLSLFRGDGGLFEIPNEPAGFCMQTFPLNDADHYNSNGLLLGYYHEAIKSIDEFSNLKHNSHLVYTMAAMYAKEQRLNDVLVQGSNGSYCDSSIANFFLVKDKLVITPHINDGPVAGVMRRYILKQLPAMGYEVREESISMQLIEAADEMFLTNAIKPIRWVRQIGGKEFTNTASQEIFRKLF